MKHTLRAGSLAALVCAAWLVAPRTGAQEVRLTGPQYVLAFMVAKVAANEASLWRVRPAEVALIWQVTESRASTTASRARWLRRHSSCVLGPVPPERRDVVPEGNCVWSWHLSRTGSKPRNWPSGVPWARYRTRWEQVQTYARMLVGGYAVHRPCPETPWTWGGRTLDMDWARARGLRPLGCEDRRGRPTLNEGFAPVDVRHAGGGS